MPKVIKIKRGDVNSLNNHILADGELAFTRHRVMEGGIQRGETVEDHYFRVGDGTQAGGLVPGSSSIGVGLLFAISTAASATRQIEALVGEYWTPWKMKSFVAPYNPYRSVDTTRDCLTPDIYNSIVNVHLGNGFLMFDGTAFEMRIRGNNRFLYETDFLFNSPVSGGANSSIFFGLYTNTADWTGGDTHRRCGAILIAAANNSTSTATKQHMVGAMSSVSNYSDVTCAAGICYSAMTQTVLTTNLTQPESKEFEMMVGYQVETWNAIKWFDGTPAHTTAPIKDFYGFKVLDQTSRMFRGLVHAIHVGSIDTTNYSKGLYMEQIGGSSSLADGIYINRVGTNVARDAGAIYADGITIRSVGWYNIDANSGCTLAGGLFIDDIRGKEGACGIRITSVTSSSDSTTDLAVGIKVGNLKRLVSTDGWGYGFYFAPEEPLELSGCVPFAIEGYDVASGSGYGFAYGYDAYGIGQTNAINVYAFSGYRLGNAVTTTSTWGLFLGGIESCLYSRGIQVSGVHSDSDQTLLSPFAKGLDIATISGTRDSAAYGIFAEGINANNSIAAGIYLGDIYSSNIANVSNIFGVYKQGQTTRYFKSFIVFGSGILDCPTAGSDIYGVYFNSLGKSCYSAVGAYFDSIGCDTAGAGTSTVARGIYMKYIGNDTSAVVSQGILIGEIRGKGDSCGIRISSVKTTGTFNNSNPYTANIATGVRVGNLHGDGTTGWGVGFLVAPTMALQLGGGIGYSVYNLDVVSGSTPGHVYAMDVFEVGTTNALWAHGFILNKLGNIINTTHTYGMQLQVLKSSLYTSGIYISNVQSSSPTLATDAFAEGLHITDVTSSQQSGTYGVVAENLISANREAVGYYVGEIGSVTPGNLTSNNWVSAFHKATQSIKNFHNMTVIGIMSQDVSPTGDTNAVIYGLSFASLGDRYCRRAYGISMGNIASDTSSVATDAFGIDMDGQIGHTTCTFTRGIHIGATLGASVYAIKIDNITGGDSAGIYIAPITGTSTVFGLDMGALECTSGTTAKGLNIASIHGYSYASGLEIGNIATHGLGTSSNGIYLTSVSSTSCSKGLWIGNVSTSANSSTAYGLYTNTITADTTGSISYGVRMETISAPVGVATGIHLQSVWGLDATGLNAFGVEATGASGNCVGLHMSYVRTSHETGGTSAKGIYVNLISSPHGIARGIDFISVNGRDGARGISIGTVTSTASSVFCIGLDLVNVTSSGANAVAVGTRIAYTEASSGHATGIMCNDITASMDAKGIYFGHVSTGGAGPAYGADINDVTSGSSNSAHPAIGYRVNKVHTHNPAVVAAGFYGKDITSTSGPARGIHLETILSGSGETMGINLNGCESITNHAYGIYMRGIKVSGTGGHVKGLEITDCTSYGVSIPIGDVYGIHVNNIARSGSSTNACRGIMIENIKSYLVPYGTGDSIGLEINYISGTTSGNHYTMRISNTGSVNRIKLNDLPTSAPAEANLLWRDSSGFIKISS